MAIKARVVARLEGVIALGAFGRSRRCTWSWQPAAVVSMEERVEVVGRHGAAGQRRTHGVVHSWMGKGRLVKTLQGSHEGVVLALAAHGD